jgi:AraC family transcriptional regulator of arabinose operon
MLTFGYLEHPLNDRYERASNVSYWTLEYLCLGRTWVRSADEKRICVAPSIMLIPPFTPYTVEWAGDEERWTEIYAIFDPPLHWNDLLSRMAQIKTAFIQDLPEPEIAGDIEDALQMALASQRLPGPNRQTLAANALERALLLLDECFPLHGRVCRDERIEKVLHFISAHYEQPLTLDALAKQVFLSPSRFSHLFKLQIGQAPMRYLEAYRLERAAEKLLSGRGSIEQVAISVGFNNAFHFSTRFRKQFGRSPRLYRMNPK